MGDTDREKVIERIGRYTRGRGAALGSDSVLLLAAAAYGSRPNSEVTSPTGFNPEIALLFEGIVESAYLVACADGEFDAEERELFQRLVSVMCDGKVHDDQVESLVADLEDQLREDGRERRIARVAEMVRTPAFARELLRAASLIAMATKGVSESEREVLEGLVRALSLSEDDLGEALGVAAEVTEDGPLTLRRGSDV